MKLLFNSFHFNGPILGFKPQKQLKMLRCQLQYQKEKMLLDSFYLNGVKRVTVSTEETDKLTNIQNYIRPAAGQSDLRYVQKFRHSGLVNYTVQLDLIKAIRQIRMGIAN